MPLKNRHRYLNATNKYYILYFIKNQPNYEKNYKNLFKFCKNENSLCLNSQIRDKSLNFTNVNLF